MMRVCGFSGSNDERPSSLPTSPSFVVYSTMFSCRDVIAQWPCLFSVASCVLRLVCCVYKCFECCVLLCKVKMDCAEKAVPDKGKAKKRHSFGRVTDASKRLRNHTYETGENCNCKRLACFTNTTDDERKVIVSDFNGLKDRDAQNLYLGGLIQCNLVKNRRNRPNSPDAALHSHAYSYKARVKRNDAMVEIPVCYKGFIAIHGITPRRIQTIQEHLSTFGKVLPDKRGKHKNRPHGLTEETTTKVHEHIQSLRGRKSHYSLKKSDKIYLPDELNIKKLHDMYKTKYPNNPVSYDSYRKIFETNYNISFGYPRSDTCSHCDDLNAKIELVKKSGCENNDRDAELNKLNQELELHKRKASVFYERKKIARIRCSKTAKEEAITIDYQKNLCVPNIATNTVYYKRQLTIHLFNIHVLSTGESYFYVYDQTIAKRGAKDVASMLNNFILEHLSPEVQKLHIFCDSCAGQNKNATVIKYLHYAVHFIKRLETVTVTFPERGHSYLECDRNMTLIPKKQVAEIPQDLYNIIRQARVKPSPFQVIQCEQELFRDWTTFFKESKVYKGKLAMQTRPIKELEIKAVHYRTISHRPTFNGSWESSVVLQTTKNRGRQQALPDGQFLLPEPAYEKQLPLPEAKWKDLQVILFCVKN